MEMSYVFMYIILASVGLHLTNSAPVEIGEENYRSGIGSMSLKEHIKIICYQSKRHVEIIFNTYCNRFEKKTNTYISICTDEWLNSSKAIFPEFDYGNKTSFMNEKDFTNSLNKLAYALGRYINLFEILLETKKASLCKHIPTYVNCNLCNKSQKRVSTDYCDLKVTTHKLKDLEVELLRLSEKHMEEDLEKLRHFVEEASLQHHEGFVLKMLTKTLTGLNQIRGLFVAVSS